MIPKAVSLYGLRITLDHVGIATDDGLQSALERTPVFFAHPSSTDGVLIEFSQRTPEN